MQLCLGDAGRHSDGGVFANSRFGQAVDNGDLNIPDDQPLPGIYISIQYNICMV